MTIFNLSITKKNKALLWGALFISMAAACFAVPAQAQSNTQLDMPAISAPLSATNAMTHPILSLTPDRSEMIKLNSEAASVIVGNPNHVSVMLDTPDTLIVVPRAEGASHFTVLGKDGSILMQRHVIVGAAKDQYVRIRRSCNANDRDCKPTSVYFCPDMCHEVQENSQTAPRRR